MSDFRHSNLSHEPIGIFDSGVGGLSVAKAIRARLPNESLHYVADQQFNPYGEQDREIIAERSSRVVEFLLDKGCKAIVVACNTATVNAIETVRGRYDVPFIGVEPGVKPAAERTRSGVIGVLATSQTLGSHSYKSLKRRFATDLDVVEQACPAFVRLVEQGQLTGDEVSQAVESYVTPLLDGGADQIVLGCTHFSFLTTGIEEFVRQRAVLIDTAQPVASELARRLESMGRSNPESVEGTAAFWSSRPSESERCSISHLWGEAVKVSAL